MFLVQKVATIGSILSLFAQRSRATALDITGLAFQATIFTLVAISWIFRVVFPPAPIGSGRGISWLAGMRLWDGLQLIMVFLRLYNLFCIVLRDELRGEQWGNGILRTSLY